MPDIDGYVLESPDDVAEFWQWLTSHHEWIAADTETTGLNQYEDGFAIRLIQFGDGKQGWAVPFQQWRGLVEAVFLWLSEHRVKVVWWNANYDLQALEVEGVKVDYSIQVDCYVLCGLSGFADMPRALKPVAVRELGGWANAGQDLLHTGMKNAGWDWATVPLDWNPFPLYSVMDTIILAQIWEKWQPEYTRWRAMHDLEMETIRICNRMIRAGLAVDISYLSSSAEQFAIKEAKIESWLKDRYSITPGQTEKLGPILDAAGLIPPGAPRTESGKISVTAAVLKECSAHPAARAVLQWRKMHKTRTSYLEPLVNFADGRNLVHCQIQPMQAKTGRMSISRPALQQLPGHEFDDDTDNVAVRRGIIPRQDDHAILTLDFAQIELRLWATLFDDHALATEIKKADASGLDFFTSLCRSVYKEPDFKKSDHRRTKMKSATYAKLFDGSLEVAARTAGVSPVDMMPNWQLLGETFPSMASAGLDRPIINRYGSGKGAEALSPFDRRFAVVRASEVRKLPNYLTQGSAAIALKHALCNIERRALADYLVIPVHDEVVASVPKDNVVEVMAEMKEAMESVVTEAKGWLVGVPAEGGAGNNWAEAKG